MRRCAVAYASGDAGTGASPPISERVDNIETTSPRAGTGRTRHPSLRGRPSQPSARRRCRRPDPSKPSSTPRCRTANGQAPPMTSTHIIAALLTRGGRMYLLRRRDKVLLTVSATSQRGRGIAELGAQGTVTGQRQLLDHLRRTRWPSSVVVAARRSPGSCSVAFSDDSPPPMRREYPATDCSRIGRQARNVSDARQVEFSSRRIGDVSESRHGSINRAGWWVNPGSVR